MQCTVWKGYINLFMDKAPEDLHSKMLRKCVCVCLWIAVCCGQRYSIGQEEMGKIALNTGPTYGYTSTGLNMTGVTFVAFTVKACHDVHVTPQPGIKTITTEAYEIVIGGCNNSDSLVRKPHIYGEIAAEYEGAVVDCNVNKQFWIAWADSKVEVGSGLQPGIDTFMSVTDTSLYQVSGVAISTGWGSSGEWIINGSNDDTTVNHPGTVNNTPNMITAYPLNSLGKVALNTAPTYGYTSTGLNMTGVTFVAFTVKACSDVHVTPQPGTNTITTDTYEIVIGGWNNSDSLVRKPHIYGEAAAEYIGAVVDCNVNKEFWISWANSKVEAGRGLQPGIDAFISFTDTSLYQVSGVAISTGWGSSGEWIINGLNDNTTVNPPGMEEKPKTVDIVARVSIGALVVATMGVSMTVTFLCMKLLAGKPSAGQRIAISAEKAEQMQDEDVYEKIKDDTTTLKLGAVSYYHYAPDFSSRPLPCPSDSIVLHITEQDEHGTSQQNETLLSNRYEALRKSSEPRAYERILSQSSAVGAYMEAPSEAPSSEYSDGSKDDCSQQNEKLQPSNSPLRSQAQIEVPPGAEEADANSYDCLGYEALRK